MIKPTRTCVLVADSKIAKFFVNEGPGKGLSALPELTLEVNESNDDEAADRPGRSFDRMGAGRHAMEAPTDPLHRRAELFVKRAVEFTAERLRKKEFDQLVLVAPPDAIAIARGAYPKLLKDKLKAELVKDLTHLPTDQLMRHLDEVLAVSPGHS